VDRLLTWTRQAETGGVRSLIRQVRRRGVKVEWARGELLQYLERMGARSSIVVEQGRPIRIVLRKGATRADVMHEWMHATKRRRGIPWSPDEERAIEELMQRCSRVLRLGESRE
jgi:hypothetical protein